MKIEVAAITHRHVDRATITAGHREELKPPLKEWVSWVSYLHEVDICGSLVTLRFVLLKGINMGWRRCTPS
jgi:hypothetical protein